MGMHKTKQYNLDRATLIGTYDNGLNASDVYAYGEALYRNKNGEYFLKGAGGAMTHYAWPCGQNNIWRAGKKTIPLTRSEAIEWGEINLSVTELEQLLSDE